MDRGLANFFARLASTKNRNMFSVRLGSQLILAHFGIVGIAGAVVGWFLRGLLGLFIEDGVFLIDISLDAYREGQKMKEFEIEAKAAYEKATAKVYDESEKEKIRQEYLAIISRIGNVGL